MSTRENGRNLLAEVLGADYLEARDRSTNSLMGRCENFRKRRLLVWSGAVPA